MSVVEYLAIVFTVFSLFSGSVNSRLVFSENDGGSLPEQVHISTVAGNMMRISWVTQDDLPPTVDYGTTPAYGSTVTGTTTSYKFLFRLYRSGKIHEALIGPLAPSTTYYYRLSGTSTQYSFQSLPDSLPVKLAIVGNLGQSDSTSSTIKHISSSSSHMTIVPGNLAYDRNRDKKWDDFGRLVEPLSNKQPWMVAQGNEDEDYLPIIAPDFRAYNIRWHMPFETCNSTDNAFYSFDLPGIHFVVLSMYTEFSSESPQYLWLESDLAKVDRAKTPWLIAILHVAWYTSNRVHYVEGEVMREEMEPLLYKHRVDFVFNAGINAYERFGRVNDKLDDHCGAVHITVGTGGGGDSLDNDFGRLISLYREANYGHGELEVVNSTHALWTWYRNSDDVSVSADSAWINSLYTDPSCRI